MPEKKQKPAPSKRPEEPTPLERMADLTRRVVQVSKDEAVKPKRKRKH